MANQIDVAASRNTANNLVRTLYPKVAKTAEIRDDTEKILYLDGLDPQKRDDKIDLDLLVQHGEFKKRILKGPADSKNCEDLFFVDDGDRKVSEGDLLLYKLGQFHAVKLGLVHSTPEGLLTPDVVGLPKGIVALIKDIQNVFMGKPFIEGLTSYLGNSELCTWKE